MTYRIAFRIGVAAGSLLAGSIVATAVGYTIARWLIRLATAPAEETQP